MDFLRQLNARPIAYYPIYRDITGSTTAGILLSQLMYWFSKKDKIYKTDSDIMSETKLSENELRTAKQKVKKLSFIKVTLEGLPRKTFYHINWKKYEACLVDFTTTSSVESTSTESLNPQDRDSGINGTITKTTSENTTKTTSNIYRDPKNNFVPPLLDEVTEYMFARIPTNVNPEDHANKFMDHYNSNGWKVGINSMVDWKSSVNNWISRMNTYTKPKNNFNNSKNTTSNMAWVKNHPEKDHDRYYDIIANEYSKTGKMITEERCLELSL